MPTHSVKYQWSRNGEMISREVDISADGEKNIDVTLTASQTNKRVVIAIDVSEVKSLMIDSKTNVSIKTNSTSSPAQTLTIVPGYPWVWTVESGLSNPLSTDITDLYITNADASTGLVTLRVLQDITP